MVFRSMRPIALLGALESISVFTVIVYYLCVILLSVLAIVWFMLFLRLNENDFHLHFCSIHWSIHSVVCRQTSE